MSGAPDVTCAGCGELTRAAGRFCIHCGTPTQQSCPSCGEEVVPGARFCLQCGTALTGAPAPSRAPTATVSGGGWSRCAAAARGSLALR